MDQSVKDAIKKLIEDGKITEEESQEYFPDLVDRVGYLADVLHLLMCKEKHNDDVTNIGQDNLCDYYIENQLSDADPKYTIENWRQYAEGVIESVHLDTMDDLTTFTKAISAFYKSLEDFIKVAGDDGFNYVWQVISIYI